jgi:hypothetical protein
MMMNKKQEEALHQLECNTHLLWKKEAALAISRPFGFDCKMREYLADGGPRNPKGLYLDSGAESAVGLSSWDLSGQIARHVGAKSESKLGRGFQVRADCQAIREKLNEQA